MASKIVVIGDINGHVSEVFGKLTALHNKQHFAFAVIAGNLFADSKTATEPQKDDVTKLLEGLIDVPLPIYFAMTNTPFPSEIADKLARDGEVCRNLMPLGRKTSLKTSEGIKLVAIGGKFSDSTGEIRDDKFTPIYNEKDVDGATKFKDAHVLVTSDWPENITSGSKVDHDASTTLSGGASCLSNLCSVLKPRYYFSTSPSFFEREPFFHDATDPLRPVTRFISLAPYGNADKQKWIYAFSLDPSASPPNDLSGCTASPFGGARKRKAEGETPSGPRFSGEGKSYRDHDDTDRGDGPRKRFRRNGGNRAPQPQECYFCVSNPSVETHMVASIGEHTYMTIAKGPLSTRETFSGIGFPCNMIIIPLPHTPTIAAIPDKEAREETRKEMLRFKEALQSMVSAKSTNAEGESKLGAVTWTITRNSGVHLHWQFIPMPAAMIEDGLIEAGFDVEAENLSYPPFAKSQAEIAEVEEGNFFKVMLWSENTQKEIALPLDGISRFDLQFGRRVLGKFLELETRGHWKDCIQSKSEEEADAEAFKKAFKAYDFTLE